MIAVVWSSVSSDSAFRIQAVAPMTNALRVKFVRTVNVSMTQTYVGQTVIVRETQFAWMARVKTPRENAKPTLTALH